MTHRIDYRGFKINLKEVRESAEERLKRGDFKSRIIGYYFHLWLPVGEGRWRRIKDESADYPTFDTAFDNAQGTVDAIVDSLE